MCAVLTKHAAKVTKTFAVVAKYAATMTNYIEKMYKIKI